MNLAKENRSNAVRIGAIAFLIMSVGAALPTVSTADIIWSGDYETGSFMQWRNQAGNEPNFSGMPAYCRPVGPTSYNGDGSCLELVSDVVRDGSYAAKFTIKNAQNAEGEPEDCGGMPDCTRRIVSLKGWHAMESDSGTVLPYMSERWISISHYVPEDWIDSGSGWGPLLFEMKPYINNDKVSPFFSISLNQGAWRLTHRWSDVQHLAEGLPWQQQMFYHGNYEGQPYPNSGYWSDGIKDFPNVAESHAALQSVNKGGWTDWVIHMRFDARGAGAGGQGFIEVFKREDSGPWIEVLDIRPKVTNRGGMTFDHGIGYNSPPRAGSYDSFGDHGGFAIVAGMYLQKGQVWNLPSNRVIYNDNIKVGDENSSLSELAPGGVQITSTVPPNPPVLF